MLLAAFAFQVELLLDEVAVRPLNRPSAVSVLAALCKSSMSEPSVVRAESFCVLVAFCVARRSAGACSTAII